MDFDNIEGLTDKEIEMLYNGSVIEGSLFDDENIISFCACPGKPNTGSYYEQACISDLFTPAKCQAACGTTNVYFGYSIHHCNCYTNGFRTYVTYGRWWPCR